MVEQFLSDPGTWVDRHGNYLYAYALKRVRDPVAAEDLVQETLIAGLEARSRFAGRSSEKTWLVGILKNKVMDHFRRNARRNEVSASTSQSEEGDPDYFRDGPRAGDWKPERRPSRWSVDFSDPVERKELLQFLENCLIQLEPRQADAFVLREMEMLESHEICNILGISRTNLRVILFRARKKLRRCLEWRLSTERTSR